MACGPVVCPVRCLTGGALCSRPQNTSCYQFESHTIQNWFTGCTFRQFWEPFLAVIASSWVCSRHVVIKQKFKMWVFVVWWEECGEKREWGQLRTMIHIEADLRLTPIRNHCNFHNFNTKFTKIVCRFTPTYCTYICKRKTADKYLLKLKSCCGMWLCSKL